MCKGGLWTWVSVQTKLVNTWGVRVCKWVGVQMEGGHEGGWLCKWGVSV